MIEVSNRTRVQIDENALRKTAESVLRKEGKRGVGLSIALVGPIEAKALNKKHRKKSNVPNVLSFSLGKKMPGLNEAELGEIVLCPLQIRKDAQKYGILFDKQLTWMLIHGVLHLLGYDHATDKEARAMEQKEQDYLSL